MKDAAFKQLAHHRSGYNMVANGQAIAPGYKPDVVLKRDNDYTIMECETGTSRKAFVGGLTKAARFLSGERSGDLVFVIKIYDNTTELQIASHLEEYFYWLAPNCNLRSVAVISAERYMAGSEPIQVWGGRFQASAYSLQKEASKAIA